MILERSGWGAPYPISLFLQVVFTAMCTISYGHHDLMQVWISCNENAEDWMARKERMAQRISNVTVVVSPPSAHRCAMLIMATVSSTLGCTSRQRKCCFPDDNSASGRPAGLQRARPVYLSSAIVRPYIGRSRHRVESFVCHANCAGTMVSRCEFHDG